MCIYRGLRVGLAWHTSRDMVLSRGNKCPPTPLKIKNSHVFISYINKKVKKTTDEMIFEPFPAAFIHYTKPAMSSLSKRKQITSKSIRNVSLLINELIERSKIRCSYCLLYQRKNTPLVHTHISSHIKSCDK